MSESKIQLNERKIRNGIRKSVEAQTRQMWDKLSSIYVKKISFDDIIMYGAKRNTSKRIYFMGIDDE